MTIVQSNFIKGRMNKSVDERLLPPGEYVDGCWYFNYAFGSRFGLNTETANSNPTYRIDKKAGVINFSSGVSDAIGSFVGGMISFFSGTITSRSFE